MFIHNTSPPTPTTAGKLWAFFSLSTQNGRGSCQKKCFLHFITLTPANQQYSSVQTPQTSIVGVMYPHRDATVYRHN